MPSDVHGPAAETRTAAAAADQPSAGRPHRGESHFKKSHRDLFIGIIDGTKRKTTTKPPLAFCSQELPPPSRPTHLLRAQWLPHRAPALLLHHMVAPPHHHSKCCSCSRPSSMSLAKPLRWLHPPLVALAAAQPARLVTYRSVRALFGASILLVCANSKLK